MYKVGIIAKSKISSVDCVEGETIEHKIERIVNNKEPITDGAPSIFTERKDGVISAYNIRTDRWEIATDAMDAVAKSIAAKREGKATGTDDSKAKEAKAEMKVVKDSGAESIQGKSAPEGGDTK